MTEIYCFVKRCNCKVEENRHFRKRNLNILRLGILTRLACFKGWIFAIYNVDVETKKALAVYEKKQNDILLRYCYQVATKVKNQVSQAKKFQVCNQWYYNTNQTLNTSFTVQQMLKLLIFIHAQRVSIEMTGWCFGYALRQRSNKFNVSKAFTGFIILITPGLKSLLIKS